MLNSAFICILSGAMLPLLRWKSISGLPENAISKLSHKPTTIFLTPEKKWKPPEHEISMHNSIAAWRNEIAERVKVYNKYFIPEK